jgi:hypothetical protein
MKLPLLHHGYQGKHERGQVPRQRDNPAPRDIDEQETPEPRAGTVHATGTAQSGDAVHTADAMHTADAVTSPDVDVDSGTWPKDVVAAPPSATGEPVDSEQSALQARGSPDPVTRRVAGEVPFPRLWHAVPSSMRCRRPCGAVVHAVPSSMRCRRPCGAVVHAVPSSMRCRRTCCAVVHAVPSCATVSESRLPLQWHTDRDCPVAENNPDTAVTPPLVAAFLL